MTPQEQTDALYTEFYQLIIRFKQEFDLQEETLIGVMEFIKADMLSGVSFTVDFDTEEGLSDE